MLEEDIMNLIIFGPQASGKGTQAKKIAQRYEMQHISTGDIFRENIRNKTKLGKEVEAVINKGEKVNDDLTNKIVQDRLSRDDCKEGFILDGYPRTYNQAEFLASLPYNIDAVINLQVSDSEVRKRISNRRICTDCGENYNLLFDPPEKEGVCNQDGEKLIQRDDDKPEAINQRLKEYHQDTEPLLDFYNKKDIVINIDGEQPIQEVFNDITEKLDYTK